MRVCADVYGGVGGFLAPQMAPREPGEKGQMTRRYDEGSIYWDRSKGLFYATVEMGQTLDGRRLRKKVSAETRAKVKEKLRDLNRDMDAGTLTAGREKTVPEWLDWWADNILPGTIKASTERQYRQVVRTWLKPNLPPKVALSKLTADHVVAMLRALEAKGLSPTTQAMARTILRRSLRHAEQHGHVSRNVAALADAPKHAGHKLDDSLTAEEVAKVQETAEGDRLARWPCLCSPPVPARVKPWGSAGPTSTWTGCPPWPPSTGRSPRPVTARWSCPGTW